MIAWALLVVSSEGQRENLADYVTMAQADAKRQAWTLERIDDFKAVATGKSGVRAPMLALVATVAALAPEERPDWVWMRRVDRVGRGRATESMLALYSLYDLGVRIWDHDTGEVRLDTAEGELPAMLKTWFGRLENEIRSGKARAFFDQRRKSGAASVTNKPPYGLKVIKGGALELVPDEADVVRKIFAMRIAGAGSTSIGNAVRAIAPLPLRKDGTPRLTPPRWMPYTITRILRNAKYRGTVVDEITWYRAQQVPAQLVNRHWDTTPVYPWPLAGAIRCECGGGMYGEPGGHAPNKIRYYRCSKPFNHPDGRPGYRADRIEPQFLELLRRVEADPKMLHRPAARPSIALIERTLKAAREERAALNRQRESVWEMHAAGHVRDEDVQERLDGLAAERDALQARIGALEVERATASAARTGGQHAADTVARAISVWTSPKATPLEQRRIAIAFGMLAGGITVAAEGKLVLGQQARREQLS